MTELNLKPGNATLADWRAIYRGAVPKLDAACRPKIKASAALPGFRLSSVIVLSRCGHEAG